MKTKYDHDLGNLDSLLNYSIDIYCDIESLTIPGDLYDEMIATVLKGNTPLPGECLLYRNVKIYRRTCDGCCRHKGQTK